MVVFGQNQRVVRRGLARASRVWRAHSALTLELRLGLPGGHATSRAAGRCFTHPLRVHVGYSACAAPGSGPNREDSVAPAEAHTDTALTSLFPI